MTTTTSGTTNGAAHILPHHLAELKASGLTDETIQANGISSEESCDRLAVLTNRRKYDRKQGPALVFPVRDETGAVAFSRIKPDAPPTIGGRKLKYLQPKDTPTRPYFPAGVRDRLKERTQEAMLTEGEKKALCATQHLIPTISLPGVENWHKKKSLAMHADLERIEWTGRPVYIAFDSDAASNPNVETAERLLAAALKRRGANVKVVRIPPGADGAKMGVDDFIVAHGAGAFRKLLDDATDPENLTPDEGKIDAANIDAVKEAKAFLASGVVDGVSRLRFWRGGYLWWAGGRYADVAATEVRGRVVRHLDQTYERITAATVNNVMEGVRAYASLAGSVDSPAWLGDDRQEWRPADVLVCQNGILHLPSLMAGAEYLRPLTPRLFTSAALDYEFLPEAPEPTAWLTFLRELWGDDTESIETMQEWFGYMLTADTRQQKILLLVGPKRSGKGTLARVLTALVGKANVCGPTLGSLATNFGLWPLWGKSVAVISDARLSGRTDQAVVVERLLSISGEDSITVDRKHQEPVTGKLSARFTILSNELPRLGDSSGALAGRMIVLRLTRSFYGQEDHQLTDRLLAELPGILWWAIVGWARLNERGHFIQPPAAAEMVGDLEDISSPVGAFLRECCYVGPGYRVATDDLYAAWCRWCERMGRREPGTAAVFGRDLSAAEPTVRKTQSREGETRYRAYEGVGLRAGS